MASSNDMQWYAVSFPVVAVILLVYQFRYLLRRWIVTPLFLIFLKYLAYPVLIRRRYWSSVTFFQGAFIGSFFGLNAYIVIVGFSVGLGVQSSASLMIRSGTMAAVNLVPLFLGGRTSVIGSLMGISLHTYYLAHHWIGRMVIVLSILHAALASMSGIPWTLDTLHISGLSSVSAMALLLLTSLWFVRRLAYELFLGLHLLLACIVVLTLLWHLVVAGPKTVWYPAAAIVLWLLNAVARLTRKVYYKLGRSDYAHISKFEQGEDKVVGALKMTVGLRKAMHIRPGQYVYLSISGMGSRRSIQSHPYMITWWDNSLNAKKLSFLIQPQHGISADLISRSSIDNVVIDGPYGKDLQLEQYETVILVAQGIGIAGVLPHLRHMIYRKATQDKNLESYRRGLITRKIDVYWVLEDNSQDAWVSEWLTELQERDASKLILTLACFYPTKKSQSPPLQENLQWRFMYQQDALPLIATQISKQVQRSPGRTKIAVCGSSTFSKSIRDTALQLMDGTHHVEFAEMEFQPQTSVQVGMGPGAASDTSTSVDIEMKAGSQMRLRKRLTTSLLAKQSIEKKNSLRSASKAPAGSPSAKTLETPKGSTDSEDSDSEMEEVQLVEERVKEIV